MAKSPAWQRKEGKSDKGGLNADGTVRAPSDGTDLLVGVEKLSFNGVTYSVDLLANRAPTGSLDFTGADRMSGATQVANLQF
jgi:hypothetical protein